MSEVATPQPVEETAVLTPPAPESFMARVKAEVAKIAHDIGVEEAHIIDLLKAHL